MSLHYGNPVANYAVQAAVSVTSGGWTAIQTGSVPLAGRQWLEFQVRGRSALALAYANVNANGTFTAPTDSIRSTIIIPAASIKVIPISDRVAVYGRVVPKAGSTQTSVKVVVTEFN